MHEHKTPSHLCQQSKQKEYKFTDTLSEGRKNYRALATIATMTPIVKNVHKTKKKPPQPIPIAAWTLPLITGSELDLASPRPPKQMQLPQAEFQLRANRSKSPNNKRSRLSDSCRESRPPLHHLRWDSDHIAPVGNIGVDHLADPTNMDFGCSYWTFHRSLLDAFQFNDRLITPTESGVKLTKPNCPLRTSESPPREPTRLNRALKCERRFSAFRNRATSNSRL